VAGLVSILVIKVTHGAADVEEEGMTHPRLTPAEQRTLRLLAAAIPVKRAAQTLKVSEWTVRTHVRNLQQKFQVRGMAAITRVAVLHEIERCCIPPDGRDAP
jgi:DNA-binding CsgD family transcriptional regulator